MCVILALETKKELDLLTLEILKNAEQTNPDGNGYATLKNGKVIFEKGISMESIYEKICTGEIVAPCVIHARITSCGITTPELTHPFVIEDESNPMQGVLEKGESVLFHNGTFSDYKDLVLKTALGSGRKLPKGNMSDTRGLAWCLKSLGVNALEYIDTGFNKFAVLNSKGLTKYGKWVNVNGIESSNNYYANSYEYNFGNFPKNTYYDYEVNGVDMLNDYDNIIEEPDYNPYKAEEVDTNRKISKKEHKANKNFLRKHGWKDFSQFTKQELQEIVNAMQTQNALVTEIEKKKSKIKKGIFGMTLEDYENLHDGTT